MRAPNTTPGGTLRLPASVFEAPKGTYLQAFRRARALAEDGWAVVPLHHPSGYGCSCRNPDCNSIGKHPRTKNGLKDASNDPRQVDTWHAQMPQANWAVVLPESVVVIDIDPKSGGDRSWYRLIEQHADDFPTPAAQVQTGQVGESHLGPVRGLHAWYRSPGGIKNNANPATGIDRRSGGGYVLAPGSWHPSGVAYEGTVPPLRDVSGWPEVPGWALAASEPSKTSEGTEKPGRRLTLVDRLDNPSAPGGRNNDLASVAGFAAKKASDEEAYRMMMAGVDYNPPLPEAEFRKTVDSIWKAEVRKREQAELPVLSPPGPETGWLVGDGNRLYGSVYSKEDGADRLTNWADFDLVATGTIHADDDTIDGYEIEVHHGDRKYLSVLSEQDLSDQKRFDRWLTRNRLFVAGDFRKSSPCRRVAHYLASQDAAAVRIVPRLGWDDRAQAFVTHEGLITAAGIVPLTGVRPDPGLRRGALVAHHYGMAPGAIGVLREVLTHHDETVTSVVGAWYCACVLKGQLMTSGAASLFPILAAIASSGHGKSTGFMMEIFQLFGSTRGQSVDTRAAFRDRVAAHRNAPAWLDDLNDLDAYAEMLRAAPVEGTFSKKGEDNRVNVEARLTAPILLSGEGSLGSMEKAMRDRTLQISLPDPKSRMSLKDPTRPQWDDLEDLKRAHPDGLSVYAGTLVQEILRREGLLSLLRSLRPAGGGRYADKLAVLRVGARVLSDLTGDLSHTARVDAWCEQQVDTGEENALTMRLIPEALLAHGLLERPVRYNDLVTPVIVRPAPDGTPAVWVNLKALAVWWRKHNRTAASRTETEDALMDQAHSLGMKGRKAGVRNQDWLMTDIGGNSEKREQLPFLRVVPEEVSARLLADMEIDPAVTPVVTRGGATGPQRDHKTSGLQLPLNLQEAAKRADTRRRRT